MGIDLITLANQIKVSNAGNKINIAAQTPGAADPAWGSITGTLLDQTDLQAALDLKLALAGGIITGNLDIGGDLTVIGDIFGFTSGTFRVISSFDDIAQYKTGSVYNLPAASYFFAVALNFGTDTINLDDANGIYVFYGANFNQLTYTGITPFIGTDKTGVSLDIIRLFLTTPNATCIKLQDGNSCILEFPVFAGCKICVDLDNMAFCTADKLAMVGCEKGLILNDVLTSSVQVGQWSGGQDLSGIAFDLSGADSERFFMTSSDSRPAATECFINVQANYGGLVDLVAGVHTPGGGDFFTPAGRDENDNDISVSAIQFVTSSKSTASIHIAPGDEAATTIADGVETVIAGTYTSDILQRFTASGARVTYTGNETRIFGFIMKCLGVPASGNNRDYNFYIKKNNTTLIPISFDPVNVDAGTPGKIICIGDVELANGDFLEPIVIGDGNSINVTCGGLAFIVGV